MPDRLHAQSGGPPWDLGDFHLTVLSDGGQWRYRFRVGDGSDAEGVLSDVKPIRTERAAQALAVNRLLMEHRRGSGALRPWVQTAPGVWETSWDSHAPSVRVVVVDDDGPD